MYSSMEIVILAAKRQGRGSTYGVQVRLNDGADEGELAELRTTASAPERKAGLAGVCASAVASDTNRHWSFSTADVADGRVVGCDYRDSVSDVVENEAQSAPCFGCGEANAADCLDLPAKRVSLRSRSDVVLVDGKQGRTMACFVICRGGGVAALVLVFL